MLTYDEWRAVIQQYGSPLVYEGRKAYEAAGSDPALCLAVLIRESDVATRFTDNAPENCNPFNLRSPGDGRYLAFGSWSEGIKAWVRREAHRARP